MSQFIPKEEIKEKESIVVKIFFWFSFLLLIISGGLSYLVDWKINENKQLLAEVDDRVSQTGTSQQRTSKDNVINYKKKLDDIAGLVSSHKAPTKVFDILESNIHSKVFISDMAYTSASKQGKIGIGGIATDLISLAQQIKLFQQYPNIERVALSNVIVNEAQKISFKMELTLRDSSLIMQ
jgi:hypothetical protein